MLERYRGVFALLVASTLVSCSVLRGSAADPEMVPKAPEPDCEPFQRDLSRPWNSKMGYCLGDDQRGSHPADLMSENDAVLIDATRIERTPEKRTPLSPAITDHSESVVDSPTASIVSDDALIKSTIANPREIDFPSGSSELTSDVKARVDQIYKSFKPTDDLSVIWLQASLTEAETHELNSDKDALGIERSLAVKRVLQGKGVSDVRIMYSVIDADKSTVSIILKDDT